MPCIFTRISLRSVMWKPPRQLSPGRERPSSLRSAETAAERGSSRPSRREPAPWPGARAPASCTVGPVRGRPVWRARAARRRRVPGLGETPYALATSGGAACLADQEPLDTQDSCSAIGCALLAQSMSPCRMPRGALVHGTGRGRPTLTVPSTRAAAKSGRRGSDGNCDIPPSVHLSGGSPRKTRAPRPLTFPRARKARPRIRPGDN